MLLESKIYAFLEMRVKMGYTRFGKFIRKLMVDNDETLKDLAELLDVSTAFVSSVLIGKKPVPKNWLESLSDHYNLDDEKINELSDAYDESKNAIKIDVSDCEVGKKKLALQFQRRLSSLSEEEVKSLLDILGKEGN